MIRILNRPEARVLPLLLLLASAPIASAWYDPGLQRWINRDPIENVGYSSLQVVQKPTHPAPNNLYTFVANTPTGSVDALGLSPVSRPIGVHDNEYWRQLGHCLRIGRDRMQEYRKLAKQGRLHPQADKWYHCVVSCEMTRVCGSGTAEILGDLHERIHGGGAEDTRLDQIANMAGRDCGGCKEKRSCEECCEDKGYRR